MNRVLVVEDDEAIRANVTRLLRLEGYEVLAAPDGTTGLAVLREQRPDLVVSDIGMPGLDGFALLEAIRGDPALAATPVLLLTALDDRASMRRGMTAGADDYLAKPFTRIELLDALGGLQRKSQRLRQGVEQAIGAREAQLRHGFTETLAGRVPAGPPGPRLPDGAVPEATLPGVVLAVQIRDFTALAERLQAAEVAELLTVWGERAGAALLQRGGAHLTFAGEHLLSVFPETAGAGSGMAARAAVAAALSVRAAAQGLGDWIGHRFAQRAMPRVEVGAGLHRGTVTLHRIDGPGGELVLEGEPVRLASALPSAGMRRGWAVVASRAVLEAAGLDAAGATWLDLAGVRVEAAQVADGDSLADEGAPPAAAAAVLPRAALRANAEMTARAVKGALQSRLATLKAHAFAPGQEPPRLRGYRLTRKIGTGGMTDVYLAQRDADGLEVVLKVLEASGDSATPHLSRFIQEYALLSRIDHPHVVRIHDQGFTDDHAYIAMEYFPLGDLRAELAGALPQRRALEVLAQVARALDAIHGLGVVHRDLKPENIMRRADGSVALADFGIAKSLLDDESLALTKTRHGEVVGTPYYLSPEQASGQAVTPASDLYSLGVTLYEMLTGERPYRAESLELLLARHLAAPVPRLPEAHAAVQPVLDRLMAKSPADRFADAASLLEALQARALLSEPTSSA
ncbi:MAG TPA: protein kinase [Ramlibacter sp.]|jgi:CheY-like chemotaxis protein|uniref:protein kinase domain-containing protein n=1 Tax=Ramlibacter sp. TaxID=1917967 RepID=UPI002D37A5D7|nr:protein kinase [Ramlibacter sp.]HZY18923.1 protein kinase [Ramlibacter sp.]